MPLPRDISLVFFLSLWRTRQYFVQNPHSNNIKRHYDKETILQSCANMRISCLRPDLFFRFVRPRWKLYVCVLTYYFICLETEQFNFLSYPAITNSRYYGHYISSPLPAAPIVSAITGVDCRQKNMLYFYLPGACNLLIQLLCHWDKFYSTDAYCNWLKLRKTLCFKENLTNKLANYSLNPIKLSFSNVY